ncbi:triose-phosphate isomerase [Nitrosomonas sp. Nm33]|uniref:triose-phosphate isomerase n=1 Tax=Nitrosomonas sp. Nm33 TaxID=133724 RepID=UPI000894681C|nr:triose-phosphate isomerase [Nitrosomonas sp. Nm33]SDY06874.1 triosephosphate isomerase (TIM) [Nitrosomonas sp. Nm33]
MRTKLVVGNWKMNGNFVQNQELLNAIIPGTKELRNVICAVCAPYPYIPAVQLALKDTHIFWGAQNVSQFDLGAYTGEVAVEMLLDFACRYVIVGHSERRSLFGEDNHTVAEKFKKAQSAGLIPILCVGETLAQREIDETERVIEEQLDAVIKLTGINSLTQSVIAYEPIWAIGTGRTATPAQAQSVHAFIRSKIAKQNTEVADNLQILYGGSVKASNASDLFAMPDIDGGLIGGASLIANEFISICSAAQQ